MRDPTEPFRLEPDAIYDDAALVLALSLTHKVLAKARRGGNLRFSRQGRRVLYRGSWVAEWLDAEATASVEREVGRA